jgi:hypothetical protein
MSHLHSRKRVSSPIHSPSELEAQRSSESKDKKSAQRVSSDVRNALLIVVGFLVIGLALSYVVLYHRHRIVIMNVFRDSWDKHGGMMWRQGAHRWHRFYRGAPRFVTIVMPSIVNPDGRSKRLKSISDTWAPIARAIYVVHNVSEYPDAEEAQFSEEMTPADSYSYPQLLLVPPKISPDQGVPRLIHVIREVFEKVDPDFAFFVNDHTFVIAEHVCHYLAQRDPKQDMYVGRALKNQQLVFNSGAAGYFLSRHTMSRMVQAWNEEDPLCVAKEGGANNWLQGNPGLVTAKCLKEALDVRPEDTRHRGRWHRFHAFPLTRVVSGKVDEWYLNKHEDMTRLAGFDESYSKVLFGTDCCSSETMSFHYVEHSEARALFHTREAILENPHLSDHDIKSIMIREWPKEKKEIGFYSQGLPSEEDQAAWNSLISVIRRISNRRTQLDC